jgi:LysM repeat protein
MAVCVVSYHALITSANSGAEEIALKYYTGITVKSGDTLWNLADAYIDYTQYKDKEAYINEVCSINNLSETAEIRAGQRLIVPYYSEEFVK